MAKARKEVPVESRASEKVAKGKLSPKQAVKVNHQTDAVLGKHDCLYHNCGK